MISYEEQGRMWDRATGWWARKTGLTWASDVVRLLHELEEHDREQTRWVQ